MATVAATTTLEEGGSDECSKSALEILAEPLTLPCGLTLPNRLVKCPMQETLATGPYFHPPMDKFINLYTAWAEAQYGLIITGQVQVDRRFLSVAGDVCCNDNSREPSTFALWQRWATVAQSKGTPCIVQLAHPGRMAPIGVGERPPDLRPPCPSEVPVDLGDSWIERVAVKNVLGTPRAMTVVEIDEVVAMFVHSAGVARDAGFAGIQIHGAHGFLVSQFLSPRTNKRTDDYGGSPAKRLLFLQRLVREIRAVCPPPLCLSVKLNSADYMAHGQGLEAEEGLDQVRWLRECGLVDFVEISGGNAEQKTSGLHNSFTKRSIATAPKIRASTRIREAFFTDFAEQAMAIPSPVPIQLSGGFRSRTGMADAVASRACDLVGLGRAAVLEPDLPRKIILNPARDDDGSVALSHIVRGMWLSSLIPVKLVGASLPVQFFYHNMRRLGAGRASDPDISLPAVVLVGLWQQIREGVESCWAGWSRAGGIKVE